MPLCFVRIALTPTPSHTPTYTHSNVRQQWPLLPSPTRAQLAHATWEALGAYIRRGVDGGLARLGADPAGSQVGESVWV